MSLRDEEVSPTVNTRTNGGFSLRSMLTSMQSGDDSGSASLRSKVGALPLHQSSTENGLQATVASIAPSRFGFGQLGARHADALRRISEKSSAAALPTAGSYLVTAKVATQPSQPKVSLTADTSGFVDVCKKECKSRLLEMAHNVELATHRAHKAEAAAGEQSRALWDAKQRLASATAQVKLDRSNIERLYATVAAHERTIAAHAATVAKNEANVSASVDAAVSAAVSAAVAEAVLLEKEAADAEQSRQQAKLADAHRSAIALQQAVERASDKAVAAEHAATKAATERDAALVRAHSVQERLDTLSTTVASSPSVCAAPSPHSHNNLAVSDAAAATGHCIAVGIGVEAGVVDICGEWGEWNGKCDLLHACTLFYHGPDEHGRKIDGCSSSKGDYTTVGASADPLVGAIIADLKERMETNIKSRMVHSPDI